MHWAVFVCLFEIGQALVGYIWATRHKLFERDLLWEVAEVCGSSKETKFETFNMVEMFESAKMQIVLQTQRSCPFSPLGSDQVIYTHNVGTMAGLNQKDAMSVSSHHGFYSGHR